MNRSFLRPSWTTLLVISCLSTTRGFLLPASTNHCRSASVPFQRVPFSSTQALPAAAGLKEVAGLKTNNVMRGKLAKTLSKLLVPLSKYQEVFGTILKNTYWPEVFLIAILTQSTTISEWLYRKRPKNRDAEEKVIQATFKKSKTHTIGRVLEELGELQLFLYVSDVCLGILKLLGFEFVPKLKLQQVAGTVIFTTWAAVQLSQLKYQYLQNANTFGLASFRRRRQAARARGSKQSAKYNRFANSLLDIIIYFSAFMAVLDMLGLQAGWALKSIFGFGSFGTLVLSLASKDVAAEFVGGIMIQTSNFFDEGEVVVLQDGTRGTVVKMGWLHTYILRDEGDKHPDFIVRIPNSQISHQRISREKR